MQKLLWIIATIVVCFGNTSCLKLIRDDAPAEITYSAPMPKYVVKSDADPKTVVVNVQTSVPGTGKEAAMLRCLVISELQKSGWKALASSADCEACRSVIKNECEAENTAVPYQEYLEEIYGPFVCTEHNARPLLNLDIKITAEKKDPRILAVIIGVLSPRSEISAEVDVSRNTTSGKIRIAGSLVDAKAPTIKGAFGTAFGYGCVGRHTCVFQTNDITQALNEAAVKIARMLRAIKK